MPTVSIITPLHNGAARIEECLASVQAQSFPDYEHLVIDNLSSDDGAARVRQAALKDPRIRMLTNAESRGAGPTRNVGIMAARGRFIAFLDCDNFWKPEKLERQISFMCARGLAFSWTAYDIVTPDGVLIRTQVVKPNASRRDVLTKRAIIGCLTAIYDREILGRRLMNDLPMRQDFCLWIDILEEIERSGFAGAGLEESLAVYRTGGMTSDKRKAARAQWTALRRNLGLGRVRASGLFAAYALRTIADRVLPVLPGSAARGVERPDAGLEENRFPAPSFDPISPSKRGESHGG